MQNSKFIQDMLSNNVYHQLDQMQRNATAADVLINAIEEQNAARLSRCYSLIKELFPATNDMDALLAAGAMMRSLFKD